MFNKYEEKARLYQKKFDWDAFWSVVGLIVLAILGLYGLGAGWFS